MFDSALAPQLNIAEVVRAHFDRELGPVPNTFNKFEFRVEQDHKIYTMQHVILVAWRYANGPWTCREFLPSPDELNTMGLYVSIFRWLINELEPRVLLLREAKK